MFRKQDYHCHFVSANTISLSFLSKLYEILCHKSICGYSACFLMHKKRISKKEYLQWPTLNVGRYCFNKNDSIQPQFVRHVFIHDFFFFLRYAKIIFRLLIYTLSNSEIINSVELSRDQWVNNKTFSSLDVTFTLLYHKKVRIKNIYIRVKHCRFSMKNSVFMRKFDGYTIILKSSLLFEYPYWKLIVCVQIKNEQIGVIEIQHVWNFRLFI